MKRLFALFLIFVLVLSGCGGKTPQTLDENHALFSDLPVNTYDSAKFYADGEFLRYENALVGIDVSAHQGEIDWETVRADGVDFAIIRAAYRGYTNGGVSMDPYFLQNLNGAKNAGLQVGVYFFSQATSKEEAQEEADFLLQCLDGAALDFPVYYDWEPIEAEARTDDVSGADVTVFAKAFCDSVKSAGYDTGVYFNESMGYLFLHLSELGDYEFWLAQYKNAPDFYYDFTIWQYSSDGEVAGIKTPVDLNLRFAK